MKKVLSLAIAAALVAPAAAMAEATLFGKAHFIIENVDDDSALDANGDKVGDVWGVDSIHSRIGVKGSEDLGNGLTGVYHFEFKVNQDSGDGLGDRNQFIGLAGGFGTMLLGRHDTPLKMSQGAFDEFGDLPHGDIASVIPGEDRVDNVIAYVSPAFGGVTLVGALVAGEQGDTTVITDGGTPPTTLVNAPGSLTGFADHYSLAGLYSNGPIFASLAYNQYDLGELAKQVGSITGLGTSANPTLLRATFIWDGGMWKVGGMFSSMDLDLENILGPDPDGYESDAFGISGHIKVGANGKVKAQYLQGDGPVIGVQTAVSSIADDLVSGAEVTDNFDPNVSIGLPVDETTQFSLGYEHSLTTNTTLHAGYTKYEVDYKAAGDQDLTVDALFGGMIMNF